MAKYPKIEWRFFKGWGFKVVLQMLSLQLRKPNQLGLTTQFGKNVTTLLDHAYDNTSAVQTPETMQSF